VKKSSGHSRHVKQRQPVRGPVNLRRRHRQCSGGLSNSDALEHECVLVTDQIPGCHWLRGIRWQACSKVLRNLHRECISKRWGTPLDGNVRSWIILAERKFRRFARG